MISNFDRRTDHLPTLEERIPIAGAAPPAPAQRDLVGDLRRTHKARARARPESSLDLAIRAICAIPDSTLRTAGYDALAESTGEPLDTILRRAWWLRQEARS